MANLKINYVAEPTLKKFHRDNSFVRCVRGPIGSGKSVGCAVEILARAMQQAPNDRGVRRTRWAIIRNTYGELKATTIKTFQEWIPENICRIVYDTPIRGMIKLTLADNTTVEGEVLFLALDKPKDEKKLLSLELTGGWINEAREMPKRIVDALSSRIGRFPPAFDSKLTWSGMIMDTNSPDDDHWWYRLSEIEKPKDWAFFDQPGALILENGKYKPNPRAENVQHQPLKYNYWLRQVAGKDPEWVKVMILGEYGSIYDGKPVYDDMFFDSMHVSDEPLTVYDNLPLYLGWDFGLTPACIIGQVSPRGQLRILRELVCESGGIRQFVQNMVNPTIKNEFPQIKEFISVGDPAGVQRSQVDETTCIEELNRLGYPTEGAVTNDLLPRRQSVIDLLCKLVDGKPCFILDPSCKTLRKGFNGGYQFERLQISGEERFKEQPKKNSYSHPHDALQYLCLAVDSNYTAKKKIIAQNIRNNQQSNRRRQQRNVYDPLDL